MITSIKVQNLRVGMYVILPLSWFKHSFLKNRFLVTSIDQIKKIHKSGLKGDKIHDYERICCIADVFDALTATRSYKKAMTPFDALKIMKEEMLGFFHKEIFENFVLLFK